MFRAPMEYYRSLPTKITPTLVENDNNLPTKEAIEANGKAMGGVGGMRLGMLLGDLDNGYVSVGNGVSLIHEIKSVKEVVEELMVDYK